MYLSPQDLKPANILYFFLPEPRSIYVLCKCLSTRTKHTGTYLSAWRPQERAYLIPERAIWSYSGELYQIISATLFCVWLHVLKEGKMPNALGKVTKYRWYLPSKVWANVYLGWCVCVRNVQQNSFRITSGKGADLLSEQMLHVLNQTGVMTES